MILDVGCGHDPRGDVNVDLFVKATKHRSDDQRKLEDKDLDPKFIPNLIRASGEYLPFRDNCFDFVISTHTIEHALNPFAFIREAIRVSKDRVEITCPHRFAKERRKSLHINHFRCRTFADYLKTLKVRHFRVYINAHRLFPFPFFGVTLPSEIRVEVWK